MTSENAAALTLPTVIVSYRLTRIIGRGGMGEVYECVHERTGAPLAIKILLADFSGKAELFERFKREAEITSRLRHPNIVKVFDFDQTPDGRPFLAMELLSGHPLDQLIEPGRPMPLARVASILDQTALGLAAAHAAGVVHRDLKPANLFVETLQGSDRELVRILDFGISKIRDASSNLTQTRTIMGTPGYMSPEQAMGRTKEIDSRSDQFSLATIVFELLTGRAAFAADNPEEEDPPAAVLFRVVHMEPPPLCDLGVTLPAEAEAALRKAMSKSVDQRFESVAAFAKAFLRSVQTVIQNADASTAASPARLTLALPTPLPRAGAPLAPTRILDTPPNGPVYATTMRTDNKGLPSWTWFAAGGVVLLVALGWIVLGGKSTTQRSATASPPKAPDSTNPTFLAAPAGTPTTLKQPSTPKPEIAPHTFEPASGLASASDMAKPSPPVPEQEAAEVPPKAEPETKPRHPPRALKNKRNEDIF